jgi:hypothetical protein
MKSSELRRSPKSSRTFASSPQLNTGWTPGGGGTCLPVAANTSFIIDPGAQFDMPIRCPGRQTRTSSSATRCWSGANIAPNVDMTTSYELSSNGRFCASATCVAICMPSLSARRFACSSNSGTKSVHVTSANRRAAARDAVPLPPPTSSTRSPGWMSTLSASSSPCSTSSAPKRPKSPADQIRCCRSVIAL